mmetsp:Transcript_16552/g.26234  ORF Transcript_16552/g.26234 Transcript_16552/m.26234 type:complete len:101 (+) Transcript_16552:272-574(+)
MAPTLEKPHPSFPCLQLDIPDTPLNSKAPLLVSTVLFSSQLEAPISQPSVVLASTGKQLSGRCDSEGVHCSTAHVRDFLSDLYSDRLGFVLRLAGAKNPP